MVTQKNNQLECLKQAHREFKLKFIFIKTRIVLMVIVGVASESHNQLLIFCNNLFPKMYCCLKRQQNRAKKTGIGPLLKAKSWSKFCCFDVASIDVVRLCWQRRRSTPSYYHCQSLSKQQRRRKNKGAKNVRNSERKSSWGKCCNQNFRLRYMKAILWPIL